jgi:hypothetical protein
LFASPSKIRKDFCAIWTNINEKIGNAQISVEDAQEAVKELVLYDALDGSRTTLTSKVFIEPKDDVPLFSIALIHTLRVLGSKSCIIMLHTSYNRERGEKEFKRILSMIKSGSELIKQFSIEHGIRCNCLCMNKNYELIDVIRDVEQQTQAGTFDAYFLIDYNEEWATTKKGCDILNTLPIIDVYIRHTKFNFSGGWIPRKMRRSAFLYSQNGTTYCNWRSDEIVALVAMALLAKKLNEGEGLSKVYYDYKEIKHRYIKREVKLFEKTLQLSEHPQKRFICGSSIGTYQFYY